MFNSIPAIRSASSSGGLSKWFANGQSDLVSLFGAEAEELFLPGEVVSGAVTGKINSTVLSPVNSPTYQQSLTGDVDDPLGIAFSGGTTDSLDAANGTILETGAGAYAILAVIKLTADANNGFTYFGKYSSAWPDAGYRIQSDNTVITHWMDGTGSAEATNVSKPVDYGAPHYVFAWYSPAETDQGLDTDWATSTNISATPGDLTKTSSIFSLGSNYNKNAAPATMGPFAIWLGSNAETVITSRAANLAAWWAS